MLETLFTSNEFKDKISMYLHVNNYIYKSCLEKSRHPGNWLPALRGKKRRKAVKTTKNCQNQPQNIKVKHFLPASVICWLLLLLNFFQV